MAFEDVFNSDLVDYSGDFEKQDLKITEKWDVLRAYIKLLNKDVHDDVELTIGALMEINDHLDRAQNEIYISRDLQKLAETAYKDWYQQKESAYDRIIKYYKNILKTNIVPSDESIACIGCFVRCYLIDSYQGWDPMKCFTSLHYDWIPANTILVVNRDKIERSMHIVKDAKYLLWINLCKRHMAHVLNNSCYLHLPDSHYVYKDKDTLIKVLNELRQNRAISSTDCCVTDLTTKREYDYCDIFDTNVFASQK